MINLNGDVRLKNVLEGHKISWRLENGWYEEDEDGLQISLRCGQVTDKRRLVNITESIAKEIPIRWITPSQGKWVIHTDSLRELLSEIAENHRGRLSHDNLHPRDLVASLDWLHGNAFVSPEDVPIVGEHGHEYSVLRLVIRRKEFELNQNSRIFLSHKGFDKPRVHQFYQLLNELGFQPWLDEADMPAGTQPHRGILDGFQHSCAAVFFITNNFSDKGFLKSEINHALRMKTDKGDRFSIITLAFQEPGQSSPEVPEPLLEYIFKEPTGDLEAMREIVRALPIKTGPVEWKT